MANLMLEKLQDIAARIEQVEGELRDAFAKENRTQADEDHILDLRVRLKNLETERDLATRDHGFGGSVAGRADSAHAARAGIAEAYIRHALNLEMTAEQRQELRSLYHGLDTAGGYLTPPMAFVQNVIQAMAAAVPFMQYATVIDFSGSGTLGAPVVDNDPSDAEWTSELSIGTEDSTMSFGRRELNVHPLTKWIKISRTLLRRAPYAEQIVRDALARKLAAAMETGFMVGNGVGQPLGLFTASDQGISTARDVSAAIGYDGLIDVVHKLEPAYRPKAMWIVGDDFVKAVRKLKNGEGDPLWQDSLAMAEPNRLLGYPVIVSPYAPDGVASGTYGAVFGDPKHYWIAREQMLEIQIAQERYIESNQIGMVARTEIDGAPVLEAGFSRLIIA